MEYIEALTKWTSLIGFLAMPGHPVGGSHGTACRRHGATVVVFCDFLVLRRSPEGWRYRPDQPEHLQKP
jgi:hypothetical protein